MVYEGIEYQIIQTLSRSEWKWVVHLSATNVKTGVTTTKNKAIEAARRVIDSAKVTDMRAKYRDSPFD